MSRRVSRSLMLCVLASVSGMTMAAPMSWTPPAVALGESAQERAKVWQADMLQGMSDAGAHSELLGFEKHLFDAKPTLAASPKRAAQPAWLDDVRDRMAVVSEPATLALFGMGLTGVVLVSRRRRAD